MGKDATRLEQKDELKRIGRFERLWRECGGNDKLSTPIMKATDLKQLDKYTDTEIKELMEIEFESFL